jgi:hypothetical protein
MQQVEFVCLALSRKYGGTCAAGLRTDGTGWIRPVGSQEAGALSPEERLLLGGTPPRLLDVLRVPVSGPDPKSWQPENCRLAPGRWGLVARPAPPELVPLIKRHLVPGPLLFGTGDNRIPLAQISKNKVAASLALVAPEHLHWEVRLTSSLSKQLRACFYLSGQRYSLAVTDVVCERQVLARAQAAGVRPAPLEEPRAGDLLLTVSLGEPYERDQCCYKLVAGVMVLTKAGLCGWSQGQLSAGVGR